jgi:hypothetical protein
LNSAGLEVVNYTVQSVRSMLKVEEGLESFKKIPYSLREFTLALDSPSEEIRNNILFILVTIGTFNDREDMFQ